MKKLLLLLLAFNAYAADNNISVEQIGNNNIAEIRQGDPVGSVGTNNTIDVKVYGSINKLKINQGTDIAGNGSGFDTGGHSLYSIIFGTNNNINSIQQNTTFSSVGQYLSTNITGNSNSQSFVQLGAGGHAITATVTGDNNTLTAQQSGTGAHSLTVTEFGNYNDALVNQLGNTKNTAVINLTNAGAPASITLNQSGGQTYSIDRICTSTCGRIMVNQQ
jgi:hypothetical protein